MTDIKILPVQHDITIKQGADWATSIYVKDDNDQPFNLTGYTAKMQIRMKAGASLIKEISSPSSGITITGATGVIGLSLTHTETALFSFAEAEYDLLIISPGTTDTYPIGGKVKIIRRITV